MTAQVLTTQVVPILVIVDKISEDVYVDVVVETKTITKDVVEEVVVEVILIMSIIISHRSQSVIIVEKWVIFKNIARVISMKIIICMSK